MERLNKINGVAESAANHAGKLIRVAIKPQASREEVAAAVEKELQALKGAPTPLSGADLTKALQDETWRGLDRIGELAAIEYRTVNLERVKAFSDQEKLESELSTKLLKLAENQWDSLAKEADGKQGNVSVNNVDWSERSAEFQRALTKEATALLTPDQLDRLRQELNIRVIVHQAPASK